MCGLGTDNCVMVPSDERGRMIPQRLEELILERKALGHIPFFVNATAGTTVIGAFDPIQEIADICQKYNCWLHVDVSLLFLIFLCDVIMLFELEWMAKLNGCCCLKKKSISRKKNMSDTFRW